MCCKSHVLRKSCASKKTTHIALENTGKLRMFARYFAVYVFYIFKNSLLNQWYMNHNFCKLASNLHYCLDLIVGMQLTFGKLLLISFPSHIFSSFSLSLSLSESGTLTALKILGLFANSCNDTM